MTNKEVINFLNQVRKIILDDKSWLESTIQPINEAFDMAINALTAQPEMHSCDCVSRNAVIQKLNTMDRYVSEELRLCDTDKKFPKNEVFIVDDVYEEIVENLPSAQSTMDQQNGGDTVSRQAAIYAIEKRMDDITCEEFAEGMSEAITEISLLPSAQPEIIRCRNCKFASGDSRICMKFGHSPIGELDFCAWAERKTDEE